MKRLAILLALSACSPAPEPSSDLGAEVAALRSEVDQLRRAQSETSDLASATEARVEEVADEHASDQADDTQAIADLANDVADMHSRLNY